MDFNEAIKQFSKNIAAKKQNIATEEATKTSLIMPFFRLLGYDVFDSSEFCPEYTADVGIKKGEKVDYAILSDGQPIILIECKSCTEHLDQYASQLFRYFGTTSAKFGILTNGLSYKFYTDLEEANKMDLTPFLEVNLEALKEAQITELKKFCKSDFDKDQIASTASELKYTGLAKELFAREFDSPSDDFIRFVLSNIYEKAKTQKAIEQFRPIIKKSFTGFINDIVNQKISSALEAEDNIEEQNTEVAEEPESKIITTSEELQSFYIIRGLLIGTVDINDITHRDTESYFGVLYKDNNRKPICRLNFDTRKKQLLIPDENKAFTRYYLEDINDIYNYKEQLIKSVTMYL